MSGARIFICYRRDCDQSRASHLRDALQQEFGADELFMAEYTVPGGEAIREYITEQLRQCEVMLVVIGPRWLTVQDVNGGPRLDYDLDYVRLEIESALRSRVKVVPVLVENAEMPAASDLPAVIADLANRAQVEIADGRHWNDDVARLVTTIRDHLSRPRVDVAQSGPTPISPASAPAPSGRRRLWLGTAGGALLLVVLAIWLLPGVLEHEDDRLRVYSSLPRRDAEGRPSQQTLDMERAIRLALTQKNGRAGDREVVYEPLDASNAKGETPASIIAHNARTAANDHRTAAYIGDFNSDDSQESIQILSRRRVPQISPASSRTGLTVTDERGDLNEPERYYPTGYRNFVRIIPNDIVQARALLELMLVSDQRPCTTLAIVDDASAYGRGLSNDILAFNRRRIRIAFRQSVEENGAYEYLVEQAVARGADCLVFAGVNRTHTVEMFRAFARRLRDARLFGTDGLADPGFYASADWLSWEPSRRVRIMVPPRVSSRYGRFRRAFAAAYDHEPELSAVYGYEAMLVALDAIARSETAKREDIVRALFETPRRDSVLGTYRFDRYGDTTLDRYGYSKISDGALSTPMPTPRIAR